MSAPEDRSRLSGMGAAVGTSIVVGAIAVGAALYGASAGSTADTAPDSPVPAPDYATAEYGRRLVAHTAELLGPDQPEPGLRYIDSRLNCGSCHLSTGTEPGTLTLLLTDDHYPRFSGRAGAQTDIEDRINECMQRSMNGKPLPMDSPEMVAMAAYLRSLGRQYQATAASKLKTEEPPAFKTPTRAASVDAGEIVYRERCSICHGADGTGLLATDDRAKDTSSPAVGARLVQQRRGYAPRADRRALHQEPHAARRADAHRRPGLRRGRLHQLEAAARDVEPGAGLPRSGGEAHRQPLRPLRRRLPRGPASPGPFQPIDEFTRR
ncbi:MAG: hypothetical protein R2712_21460 [Vicinamibacterales bacterium]